VPDLPTRAELFQVGADAALLRAQARPNGARLSPSEIYTEGSDSNILINAGAAMAHEVLFQSHVRLFSLLLDGASAEDLDRLVADRWSPTIVRKQASPSAVPLSFSRSAGPLPAVSLPAGSRFSTPDGFEFELTAAMSLPAFSTGPTEAPAQSLTTGSATNVQPGTISIFTSASPDPDLQVTNLVAASGGDETETDPSLRKRARAFYAVVRRGTRAAIEFGALTVAGVRSASAIEEVDGLGDPTGIVDVYIADPAGNGNALLAAAVRVALLEWRCEGVQTNVIGSTPIYVPIELKLRFESSANPVVAFDRVRLLVAAAVNQLAPQQTLPTSLILATVRRVPGVIVLDDALVNPPGDVVPAIGEILKTTIALITAAP